MLSKYSKNILIALCAFALSACGSSSNGSASWGWGDWTGTPPEVPGNPDPGNPDPGNPDPGNPDPGNPDPGNPEPFDTRNLFKVSKNELEQVYKVNTVTDGLEIILVDDKGNTYAHSIRGQRGNKTTQYMQTVHDMTNLDHSLYGLADFLPYNLYNSNWEGFAMGEITEVDNMPTTGTATYKGNAMGVLDKSLYNTNPPKGLANITVDFGKAKVDGLLNANPAAFGQGVELNANIQGANFTGEASRLGTNDKAGLVGQFNGPNAEEMVGFYNSYDADGMTGSFGAKK